MTWIWTHYHVCHGLGAGLLRFIEMKPSACCLLYSLGLGSHAMHRRCQMPITIYLSTVNVDAVAEPPKNKQLPRV